MRRIVSMVLVALFASVLGATVASAKGNPNADHAEHVFAPGKPVAAGDTVTWWCLDLNHLWQVKGMPVIDALGDLVFPEGFDGFADPSCATGFPVVVQGQSRFVAGGSVFWYTNKTYPPAIRASLQSQGYPFHSQSPAEDFLSKMTNVRVEIRTVVPGGVWAGAVVTDFSFDPRMNFRRVTIGDWNGMLGTGPQSDPSLGINLTAMQASQLLLVGFPGIVGPIPAGTPEGMYWACVYWTLSAMTNDGLGIDPDGNFLPGGEEFALACNRFYFVP
jgi:hypothetical protein